MEKLRESSLVLDAINARLQRDLVSWRLNPENPNVIESFSASCNQIVEHGGTIVFKVKKNCLEGKMLENDIHKYGYPEGDNWVFEIAGNRFLNLSVMKTTFKLSLGVKFDRKTPSPIGQFTPDNVHSLFVK